MGGSFWGAFCECLSRGRETVAVAKDAVAVAREAVGLAREAVRLGREALTRSRECAANSRGRTHGRDNGARDRNDVPTSSVELVVVPPSVDRTRVTVPSSSVGVVLQNQSRKTWWDILRKFNASYTGATLVLLSPTSEKVRNFLVESADDGEDFQDPIFMLPVWVNREG